MLLPGKSSVDCFGNIRPFQSQGERKPQTSSPYVSVFYFLSTFLVLIMLGTENTVESQIEGHVCDAKLTLGRDLSSSSLP